MRLARRILGAVDLPVSTVFVGGGTPTLLPPGDLGRILAAIRDEFGLAPGAEVTTEANPDSVTAASLAALREDGFTRMSFGLQSTAPHVLQVLDRTHTPGRAVDAVEGGAGRRVRARQPRPHLRHAGRDRGRLRRVARRRASSGADHVSAYSLIVEDGTRLAARIRRGELPASTTTWPPPLPAGRAGAQRRGHAVVRGLQLGAPGRRVPAQPGYWRGDDWWGVGPGAHAHVAACGGGTCGTRAPTPSASPPGRARAGARGAGGRRPSRRGRAAARAPARGPAAGRARRPRPSPRRPARPRGACCHPGPFGPGARC